MSDSKPNAPTINPATIPDAKIQAVLVPAEAEAPRENGRQRHQEAPQTAREAMLQGQVDALSSRLDGVLAGFALAGKKIPTKGAPEPKFATVKMHVPYACYINGEQYLGEVVVPENVALGIQSQLSRRKDHDVKLSQAKSLTNYEVGSITKGGAAKKLIPDVV